MNKLETLKKQQKEAKQQRDKIKEIKADSLVKQFKSRVYAETYKKSAFYGFDKKSYHKKMLIDILQNKHNASRLDVLIALQGV